MRRAGEAWYEANASFWSPGTTFQQGCEGVMAAATALGFSADELAAINQSWQDVGVVCDGGGGGEPTWSGSASPALATVNNGTVCSTLTVTGEGDAAAAQLDIDGVHDWREILSGTLEHNGAVVEAFPVGTFPSSVGAFSFTDRAVAGMSGSAAGDWILCITDTDEFGDTGTLNSWSVHD